MTTNYITTHSVTTHSEATHCITTRFVATHCITTHSKATQPITTAYIAILLLTCALVQLSLFPFGWPDNVNNKSVETRWQSCLTYCNIPWFTAVTMRSISMWSFEPLWTTLWTNSRFPFVSPFLPPWLWEWEFDFIYVVVTVWFGL